MVGISQLSEVKNKQKGNQRTEANAYNPRLLQLGNSQSQ